MKKIIGLILKEKGNKSVSIIGAGDGPTSVFLAGKIGRDYSVFTFIIVVFHPLSFPGQEIDEESMGNIKISVCRGR